MRASHWVLKELLEAVGDSGKLKELAGKFAKRYPNDGELADVCGLINRYVKRPDAGKRKEIESELKRLAKLRQIGGSGGTGLWYRDVRKTYEKGKVR